MLVICFAQAKFLYEKCENIINIYHKCEKYNQYISDIVIQRIKDLKTTHKYNNRLIFNK